MRFINPNWYVTIIVTIILFFGSFYFFLRIKRNKKLFAAGSFFLFLFSLLYPLAYFSDDLAQSPRYCQWRSYAYSEIAIAVSVPFFVCLTIYLMKDRRIVASRRVCKWLLPASFIAVLVYVSIPFIKPVIRPLVLLRSEELWEQDVCLQSSPSTCGPAALATILKQYGQSVSELEIAQKAFSCGSGTENWYLARYVKKTGYSYSYAVQSDLSKISGPAIIGVKTPQGFGHFIVFLKWSPQQILLADPLIGDLTMTEQEFYHNYQFMGFAMSIY